MHELVHIHRDCVWSGHLLWKWEKKIKTLHKDITTGNGKNLRKNSEKHNEFIQRLQNNYVFVFLSFTPALTARAWISMSFSLSFYLAPQSHGHCNVQHGPQPLPPGHTDLLTGNRKLWVDYLRKEKNHCLRKYILMHWFKVLVHIFINMHARVNG